MYGCPELESLAHPSGFDAGPDPTPESGVEQDDVGRRIQYVGRQLLEVDNHRVGREGYLHLLAQAPHTVEPPGRVLVVVVFQILYGQAETNALLDAEGSVGIEPQGIFGECAGEGPVALQFVFWRIDATLELVRGEAAFLLECPCMLHQLVDGSDLRLPRLGIRVPEKEVAREGHPIPELATEQRVNRDSELLPHKIQTPKLYGGMKLGAVVVEACCRVHDLEPQRLEFEWVVANEVGLETIESTLPSSSHLAQPDETLFGLYLDYGAHEASPVGPAGMLDRRLQWNRYGGCSYVGYLQGSSYATAGLFRQAYPEGCEQTAVDPVVCSRHEARLRLGEEADPLEIHGEGDETPRRNDEPDVLAFDPRLFQVLFEMCPHPGAGVTEQPERDADFLADIRIHQGSKKADRRPWHVDLHGGLYRHIEPPA